ncbi:MAG: alginate export family protein [Burkholderiales bacterium]|nr:alginate export family protein [Burkholderiales bacterium]
MLAQQPEEPFGIGESLARGRFTLELRPRYNRIDESNKPERSEGGTVRLAAGFRSAPIDGVRITLEGIHANHLGGRFNDDGALFATSPYPLLPDPRYTGVNQAYLEYVGVEVLRVRAGRQVVRMGNQRWISDNGFRQIPQVFDGVSASYTAVAGAELSAAYFGHVRDTSGEGQDLRLTVLHAAWNPAPGQALVAYGYFHDQAYNGAFTGFANSSYRVIGVRAEGTAARAGAMEFPYEVEYALQRPHAGGDARIDAHYWRVGGGVAWRQSVLRFDYEVKGSNGGRYGVQMPLTDFYAFNGWTLHFFNTPRQGLRDGWVTLRHSVRAFTFYAEAHRFRSDYGSIDFGRELDAGVTYAWNENIALRLQHARYDPGTDTPDPRVRKTWLTLTYAY